MIPPMRAALTDHHADGNTVGRVPDRRLHRQRTTIVRHDHVDARTVACVHGGNRLRRQLLSDDPRRRTRPRHLHPYRLGRAGRRPDARTVRQARKPGGDATVGDILRHESGYDAVCAARPLSRRTAGFGRKARQARRHDGDKGRIGDRPWTVTLPLANAAEGKGLSKLRARRKITDAEIAQTMRTLTIDEANKLILALALEHQLVTRLTSLVAVDKTVTRPAGEPLKVSELPLNLPAGWDFEKVFGERPKPVPPAAPIERRRRSVTAALGSPCGARRLWFRPSAIRNRLSCCRRPPRMRSGR